MKTGIAMVAGVFGIWLHTLGIAAYGAFLWIVNTLVLEKFRTL